MSIYESLAGKFAEIFGNDGQSLTAAEGRKFIELLEEYGTTPEYGGPWYDIDHDGDEIVVFVDVDERSRLLGDPIRFEFDDRSAIVIHGDCWGIEGESRYSLAWS